MQSKLVFNFSSFRQLVDVFSISELFKNSCSRSATFMRKPLVPSRFLLLSFCTLHSSTRRYFQWEHAKVSPFQFFLFPATCWCVFHFRIIQELAFILCHVYAKTTRFISGFVGISSRCRCESSLLVYLNSFSSIFSLFAPEVYFAWATLQFRSLFDDSASSASDGSSFDLNTWRGAFKATVNKFFWWQAWGMNDFCGFVSYGKSLVWLCSSELASYHLYMYIISRLC